MVLISFVWLVSFYIIFNCNLSLSAIIEMNSSQSIFDIEIGTRTVIDYELCAFAKVLDTTADELLKDFRDYLDKKLKN